MIEDNSDYAELVQHWLSAPSDDGGFALDWTDSLGGALERLTRGGIEVVLLDLNLPDSSGVETFLALRSQSKDIPIVVLSAEDSEAQALQLVQEGAENYLFKGTVDRLLLTRALRYAVVKRPRSARSAQKPAQTKVIGVMAAKGGAGATTVACNLAAELRRQTANSVLLADLDLEGGLASFLLGIEPKYWLDSVLENLDRLDRGVWDSMVTPAPLDCHFTSAPPEPGDVKLTVDSVRKLLVRLSPWYSWILLDLGRLSQDSLSFLGLVDQLILVTKTAVPELYQAKRALERLVRAGFDREQIRLIVNESGRNNALTSNELHSIFGIDVYAALPYAGEELESACVKKLLPPDLGAIRQELAKVARKMAGIPEAKGKKLLSSLTRRFRKSSDASESVAASGEPAVTRHEAE